MLISNKIILDSHLRREHKNLKRKTSLGEYPEGIAAYRKERKMKLMCNDWAGWIK